MYELCVIIRTAPYAGCFHSVVCEANVPCCNARLLLFALTTNPWPTLVPVLGSAPDRTLDEIDFFRIN
jgi:hypothetical protein